MKKFLWYSFIFILLYAATNGRIIGVLMYGSMLVLSCALAFLIPLAIFSAIGDLWRKHDPDEERGFVISNALRFMGVWIGGKKVWDIFKRPK